MVLAPNTNPAANACRNYFSVDDPVVASEALPVILQKTGLTSFTYHFKRLVKQTDEADVAVKYTERFRAAIQNVSDAANKISLKQIPIFWASRCLKQYVAQYGSSLMIGSCCAGYFELVKILFEKYMVPLDLVNTQEGDFSLLHYAIQRGHPRVSIWLIENGAPYELTERECKRTPLHFACIYGQEQVFNALVNKGADVNALDTEGHSPMDLAAYKFQDNRKTQKRDSLRAKLILRLFANNAHPATGFISKSDLNKNIVKYENTPPIPPFPTDVWVSIFRFLPRKELDETIKRVCKSFHNFAIAALLIEFNKFHNLE